MGKPMNHSAVLPFGKPAVVTPLLQLLAGEHADRIARLWPAPHTGFLVLPTARRHAAAILAEHNWLMPDCARLDVVHAAERARDADLARAVMNGEAPGGLTKALGRMGEVLWVSEDYETFLRLFADPETVTVLRHMPEITPKPLSRIAMLPAALRRPGIIANLPDWYEAVEDLIEAFRLALLIHGPKAAVDLPKRWERAGDSIRLFDMAAEALAPISFGQVQKPPALPSSFEPVRNRKALEAIALEFRNCLRDFAADLALGRMAVYAVRENPSPPVALAIRQDAAGWRLAEAKLRDNEDLGDAHLRHLIELLAAAGVRTGESAFTLASRLHDHVCADCGPARVPSRRDWRDRLALGSLWD